MLKKLLVVVAIAAALATLVAVTSGWKWGHVREVAPQVQLADGMPDGWTWDGNQTGGS